jgi:hypothetical protein
VILGAMVQLLKVLGVLACLLISGCRQANGLVEVTGTVTWNGTPIPAGMIVLQPLESQQAAAGCKIADGKFSLHTRPGKVRVQIDAVRTTTQRDPQSGAYLGEMYIPSRYNRESELDADITRDGENHFNFALED